MILFRAYCHFEKITDITPDILNKIGVNTLFLDIDNTLKRYGDAKPSIKVTNWLELMKHSGIKLVLCSNNFKKTVSPFSKVTGIPAVHMCLKPSPFGFWRALRLCRSKRSQILVCGDQVFTDILGARLSFMKSAYINPVDTSNEGATVRMRRAIFRRAEIKNTQMKNPF